MDKVLSFLFVAWNFGNHRLYLELVAFVILRRTVPLIFNFTSSMEPKRVFFLRWRFVVFFALTREPFEVPRSDFVRSYAIQ
jgi:hypothetical protein